MGGNIAVTIRTVDGVEFRMQRWTNSLPGFINSPKFFNDDEERSHLACYLYHWSEMRSDYEMNRHTGKFKLNMTNVYWPWPNLLAPSEYGIVVIDFHSKTIVSCNSYTTPGSLYKPRKWVIQPHEDASYRYFKKRGLIKSGNPELHQEIINFKKLGWRLIKFHHDESGLKEARIVIEKLGFKLTKEDLKKWNEK